MDTQQLTHALQRFLAQYQHARYRGIALSTPAEADVRLMREALQALLPDYRYWHRPGHDEAPSLPCHRKDFLEQSLGVGRSNLMILLPGEWMYNWESADKAVFWNSLADSYGRHTTITLLLESHETLRLLKDCFKAMPLPDCPVQVWISKHQPFVRS